MTITPLNEYGLSPTPAPNFEPGNVVLLNGQGQLMTVEDFCDECNTVDVVWFEGNDDDGHTLCRDTFDGVMLTNLDGAE